MKNQQTARHSDATDGGRSMSLTTAAHLIAEAKARIENLTPEAVAAELTGGEVLLVDIREPEERAQHGGIPGAIHTARGMLEFAADPTSAYYHPAFDPGARIILFCATGGRSALAAAMLQLLGYTRMAHLDGGLRAWQNAGLPVVTEP
jgi:rhodanese-related sulfurtransferase